MYNGYAPQIAEIRGCSVAKPGLTRAMGTIRTCPTSVGSIKFQINPAEAFGK